MPRQILYPLIACLLAGGVLAVTLVFSPSLPEPGEHVVPPRPDPGAQYEGIDPSKPTPRGKNTVATSGEVADYFIRKVDDKKQQIIVMTGKRLRPKPNGVSDVDEPAAQIHLVPGRRVFEIKGASGTLVAPNNNPESGVLSGGVIMTLYESASPDRAVDLEPNSPDVRLKIFFDEDVRFDLELGSVESAGPMHATSPQVDFQGAGLNLVYNEKRRHIARFEVAHGKELRFNPRELSGKPAIVATPKPEKSEPAAKTPASTKPTPTTEPATAATAKEGAPKPASVAPTFYKAIFENQVAVKSPEAAIQSRQLHVVFGLAEKAVAGNETPVPGGRAKDDTAPASKDSNTSKPAPSLPLAPPPGRSMMPVRSDDIVVNWAGSLLLEPLDAKPADLADANDTLFTLLGQIVVRSSRQETVAAELVEYVTSRAVVRMNGSEQSPIVIESPRMGKLIAQRKLELNQKTGEGTITGAGELIGKAPPAEVNAKEPAQRLPSELAVRWSEGVDLSFFVEPRAGTDVATTPASTKTSPAAPPVLSPSAKLDALKTALFRGQVKVAHPQFDMASDRLAIAMDEPTEKDQTPRLVKASGQVLAKARGDAKQAPMDIAAQELQIAFALDSRGKPSPSRLMARTDVKATQPGRSISTAMLDVTLVEKPAGTGGSGGTGGSDVTGKEKPSALGATTFAIHRVIADEGVRIELDQPRTLVLGRKLNTDVTLGLMQVLGDAEKPARVEREDNSLSGREIVLSDPDQAVHVDGPGSAEFLVRSADRRAAAGETKSDPAKAAADLKPVAPGEKTAQPPTTVPPAVNGQPATETPQRLKIVWLKSMDFDNIKGEAHFCGQVVTTSDRGLDLTRFQAGDVKLQIDPYDKKTGGGFKGFLNPPASGVPQAGAAAVASGAPAATGATTKPSPRQLRKLVAEESVVFESEQWQDRVGGKLATRFRLTGPVLTFDSTSEQILIPGAGTLQIEDYKGKSDKPAAAGAAGAAPSALASAGKTDAEKGDSANAAAAEVAFVGKGVTLFLWQGQLTLDAGRNDVRFDKDVRMIQLQEGRTDDVRMQCQAIAADFEATGGLASWLTGKPKEPKIDNITATGPIEIKHQGRTVRADQLYYTEAKKMVLLSSEGIRRVELEEGDTVRPARRFRWYLDRDKWVAEEPDAVRTGTKGK